jgi:hypothetical protein
MEPITYKRRMYFASHGVKNEINMRRIQEAYKLQLAANRTRAHNVRFANRMPRRTVRVQGMQATLRGKEVRNEKLRVCSRTQI